MNAFLVLTAPLCLKDKHGEVCPIDWKEGSETIKATPKDSLEYFSAAEKKRSAADMNGTAQANGSSKRAKV
jgi:hypothetical protein